MEIPAGFHEDTTALPTVKEFKSAIVRHLRVYLLHESATATPRGWWVATCLAAREWGVLPLPQVSDGSAHGE